MIGLYICQVKLIYLYVKSDWPNYTSNELYLQKVIITKLMDLRDSNRVT
jgi:hypothetical protein